MHATNDGGAVIDRHSFTMSVRCTSTGGVREAQKRRGEEYQLFWPDKQGKKQAVVDNQGVGHCSASVLCKQLFVC